MDTDGKGMDTDGTFLALQCGCKGVGMHTDGTLHVKGCKQGEIQFSDKQTNGQTDRDTSAGVELRLRS